MHGSALLVLSLGFLPLADVPGKRVSAEQAEPPLGVWRVVSVEEGGVVMTVLRGKQVTIGNGTVTIPAELGLGEELTFEPGAGRKVNPVDLMVKGWGEAWTFRGIYALDGETLRFSCAVGCGPCGIFPRKERPTGFATAPGTGQVVLTLRRK